MAEEDRAGTRGRDGGRRSERRIKSRYGGGVYLYRARRAGNNCLNLTQWAGVYW